MLHIVFNAILIVLNAFLLAITLFFVNGKKDNASKIGFGFMVVVFALNITALIGGIIS